MKNALKTGKIFDAAGEAVWGGAHSMQGVKADSSRLILLSSSLSTCPTGDLLAEQPVQHDQRHSRGDVATLHVPNLPGVLQP